MTGPSPHLSWQELACADGTPYPVEWRETRGRALGEVFERVRAAAGHRPIRVLSGYRTAAYNARVPGAAKGSQHVEGRAMDLATPAGMTRTAFLTAVLRVAASGDTALRGVGEYPWGVHVDVRPSDRLARWSGSKPIQVATA